MTGYPTESDETTEVWVRRRGVADAKKWKVYARGAFYYCFQAEVDFRVPSEDYEVCDPPVVDVTNKLRVVNGKIYCNGSDFDPDDHVATLCCNGKYRVSFNPFKVEKIK